MFGQQSFYLTMYTYPNDPNDLCCPLARASGVYFNDINYVNSPGVYFHYVNSPEVYFHIHLVNVIFVLVSFSWNNNLKIKTTDASSNPVGCVTFSNVHFLVYSPPPCPRPLRQEEISVRDAVFEEFGFH